SPGGFVALPGSLGQVPVGLEIIRHRLLRFPRSRPIRRVYAEKRLQGLGKWATQAPSRHGASTRDRPGGRAAWLGPPAAAAQATGPSCPSRSRPDAGRRAPALVTPNTAPAARCYPSLIKLVDFFDQPSEHPLHDAEGPDAGAQDRPSPGDRRPPAPARDH